MAKLKLNNKGFSLIDLIIAVAVMGLLVSPIIAQLGQTLDLSAEAKEKQYVVDSANEVIEYFRKYDDNELLSTVTGDGVLEITNDPKADSGTATCKLYDKNGAAVTWTPVGGGPQDYVVYNYTVYKLKKAEKIGKEQNDYERMVVKSDLNNKLYEAGLAIDYSNKSTSSSIISSLPSGFVFRSDNSIVKTSNPDDRYDDSKIEAIVVAERPELSVVDPATGKTYFEKMNLKDANDIDIGNIQDLDASKMAIIQGDATSLDYQLETDLTAALVQYASANPDSALGQVADQPSVLNKQIKQLVTAVGTTKSREIHTSVTCGETKSHALAVDIDGKPLYYHVRCDLYYRVHFTGTDLKVFNNYTSTTGVFKYNILDRDYYVSTPPDIYMIYEPLLVITDPSRPDHYAFNDLLSITTDEFTCGASPFTTDEASRMYLIRSTKNWEKAWAEKSSVEAANETNVSGVFDPSRYYTVNDDGDYERVQINVTQITTGTDPDKEKPIDIYTNISNLRLADQFYTNYNSGYYPYAYNGTGTRKSYRDPDKVPEEPYEYIKKVSDEVGKNSERLGQYTVTYRKINKSTNVAEGEVTYITGARGAD